MGEHARAKPRAHDALEDEEDGEGKVEEETALIEP